MVTRGFSRGVIACPKPSLSNHGVVHILTARGARIYLRPADFSQLGLERGVGRRSASLGFWRMHITVRM